MSLTTKWTGVIDIIAKTVAGMLNSPRITHEGGDRAYYVPAKDSIHMPALNT